MQGDRVLPDLPNVIVWSLIRLNFKIMMALSSMNYMLFYTGLSSYKVRNKITHLGRVTVVRKALQVVYFISQSFNII